MNLLHHDEHLSWGDQCLHHGIHHRRNDLACCLMIFLVLFSCHASHLFFLASSAETEIKISSKRL